MGKGFEIKCGQDDSGGRDNENGADKPEEHSTILSEPGDRKGVKMGLFGIFENFSNISKNVDNLPELWEF